MRIFEVILRFDKYFTYILFTINAHTSKRAFLKVCSAEFPRTYGICSRVLKNLPVYIHENVTLKKLATNIFTLRLSLKFLFTLRSAPIHVWVIVSQHYLIVMIISGTPYNKINFSVHSKILI